MQQGPGENVDLSVEQRAQNFLYDYNALTAFFSSRTYRIEVVRVMVSRYKMAIEERKKGLPEGTRVVVRFPGIDANIDAAGTTAEVERKLDSMYEEREPYIIAGGTYFSIMSQNGWDLAKFVQIVKTSLEFVGKVKSGEVDGSVLAVQLKSLGISLDLYEAAYQKLDQELEEVMRIMRDCKGQIPPLDGLLAQEEAAFGQKGGLVN